MVNSDGYIMLDFKDVDFRQTNQHIDGLFERLRSVIGTNKFVLVINANGKSPMPSAVSITNGQYVIEAYIYTFSVNSSDILHITKHSNVDDIIDDDHVSTSTTYSSSKILNVLNRNLTPLQFIEHTAHMNVGQIAQSWVEPDITADMWVLPFTSEYGLSPKTVSCIDGMCSMTFKEPLDHAIDVGVRLYKPLTNGG